MKLFLIIFLSFFFIFESKAQEKSCSCNYVQEYYPKMYEGILEYEKHNYKKAYFNFKNAFEICEVRNTTIFYELNKMAEICARLGKRKESIKYIRLASLSGSLLNDFFLDSLYIDVFDSKNGKKLLIDSVNLRGLYLNQINVTLRNEIKNMHNLDQSFRQSGYEFFMEHAKESNTIDSNNSVKLISIFENFGYPNSQLIGNYSIDKSQVSIDILLLHSKDSIRMNYFVPKIISFIEQGQCDPLILGNLIDQYYLYNGQPQIYGTYTDANNQYATMIDRTEVNKNRVNIGLPNLEIQEEIDRLKKINYPWMFNF